MKRRRAATHGHSVRGVFLGLRLPAVAGVSAQVLWFGDVRLSSPPASSSPPKRFDPTAWNKNLGDLTKNLVPRSRR